MKITIVQGAFLPVPPLMGGAVEKVWYALSQEFTQRGHEVTYLSRLCCDLPRHEILSGVSHLRIPGFDTPQSGLLLKLMDLIYSRRVQQILPTADILVTNTFWLPMLVRSERYGKIYVHVARFPKGQMRFYTHASRLQAVSTAVGRAIAVQAPALSSRVSVVPNPLPNSAYLSADDDGVQERHANTILYVGRIHPEKGIGLLLEAFNHLIRFGVEDWKLVLVGPWETRLGGGGEEYYRELRQLHPSIANRVDWVGPVFDPAQLLEYYRKACIFVYPSLASRGESFGIAPLEALASGCCVVLSDLECFRDFLKDGREGFVFDHTAAKPSLELANTLLKLVRSQDLRNEVAANGLATAQKFRIARVADQYLSDFQALIS